MIQVAPPLPSQLRISDLIFYASVYFNIRYFTGCISILYPFIYYGQPDGTSVLISLGRKIMAGLHLLGGGQNKF